MISPTAPIASQFIVYCLPSSPVVRIAERDSNGNVRYWPVTLTVTALASVCLRRLNRRFVPRCNRWKSARSSQTRGC
jgi:hypothetical protein